MTDRRRAGNGVSHTPATDNTPPPPPPPPPAEAFALPAPSRAPASIAEQIAVNFFVAWGTSPSADTWQGNGRRYDWPDGPSLYAIARGCASRVESVGADTARYTFLDGSAIVTSPNGWEIGFAAAEVAERPALAFRPANGRTVGALYYPEPGDSAAPPAVGVVAPMTLAAAAMRPSAGMVMVDARAVAQLHYDHERARAKLAAASEWLDRHGATPGDDLLARMAEAVDIATVEARNAIAELAEAEGWDAPAGEWGADAGCYVDGGVARTWGSVAQPASASGRAVNGGAL